MKFNPRLTNFVRGGFTFQSLTLYTQQKCLACPDAGGGVHDWIFHVACLLHKENCSPAIIAEFLEIATDDCDRVVPGREIDEAVCNSASMLDRDVALPSKGSGKSRRGRAKQIAKDYALIEQIARQGPGLRGLTHDGGHTPVEKLRPADVLPFLYAPDELICCGIKHNFRTAPLQSWLGSSLEQVPLLVPSPMASKFGLTQTGRASQRCLGNVGPRRYLVVEFDFKEKNTRTEDTPDAPMLRSLAKDGISVADLGASLHLHLARFANLVMILNSGNKSEHGWYQTTGQREETITKFINYARSLGGDNAMKTLCQMFRMPGAVREGTTTRQVDRFFEPGRIAR